MQDYLGVLGMPGVTAWMGVTQICQPRTTDTLVVSSAAGVVGAVVGQYAKSLGCRVVGIAGGEKCRYVTEELGFDACIDHRAHADAQSLASAVAAAAPRGVDCCFENVGGRVLDAVLVNMNDFGRIAVCGMIAGYDGQPNPITWPSLILVRRLKLQGFIVSDHMDLWPRALAELAPLVRSGRIRCRTTVTEGLENAPAAFLRLLCGEGIGKHLVKLA
jgi:NADPH-dependent curcumin reductase CurA